MLHEVYLANRGSINGKKDGPTVSRSVCHSGCRNSSQPPPHSAASISTLEPHPLRLLSCCSLAQGDASADLDYFDESSLALSDNSTIVGENGVTANLELPPVGYAAVYRVGSGSSLSANKNLVIDTTSPFVEQVTGREERGGSVFPSGLWLNSGMSLVEFWHVIVRRDREEVSAVF